MFINLPIELENKIWKYVFDNVIREFTDDTFKYSIGRYMKYCHEYVFIYTKTKKFTISCKCSIGIKLP